MIFLRRDAKVVGSTPTWSISSDYTYFFSIFFALITDSTASYKYNLQLISRGEQRTCEVYDCIFVPSYMAYPHRSSLCHANIDLITNNAEREGK